MSGPRQREERAIQQGRFAKSDDVTSFQGRRASKRKDGIPTIRN
jgi:hypothetical protein